MPRTHDFDRYVADTYARLLHQASVFFGDRDQAEREVRQAVQDAAQRWPTVRRLEDRDSWMRRRMFRSHQARHHRRRRGPLPIDTDGTDADVLQSVTALDPQTRWLVVAHFVAGIDVPSAAAEVGMDSRAAHDAVDGAVRRLTGQPVQGEPADPDRTVRRALNSGPADIVGTTPPPTGALRRAGRRRRYLHLLVATAGAVAVAAAAGFWTAAQTPAPNAEAATTEPAPPTRTRPSPEPDPYAALGQRLLHTADVAEIGAPVTWHRRTTDAKKQLMRSFPAPCLDDVRPVTAPKHRWSRVFEGRTPVRVAGIQQVVTVTDGAPQAAGAMDRLLSDLADCPRHQLTNFDEVSHVGASAGLVTLRHVDSEGVVHQRYVAVARSGPVLTRLTIDGVAANEAPPKRVAEVLALAVQSTCPQGRSRCTSAPVDLEPMPPPSAGPATFLSVVDLPLFPDVPQQWVATRPQAGTDAAPETRCNQTDLARAGARDVRSRNYVIPDAPHVPTIFGMTETTADFSSPEQARKYVGSVMDQVATCHDRQSTLRVVHASHIGGDTPSHVWQIEQRPSKNETVTFRVALLRSGSRVAHLVFTPAGGLDVSHQEFVDLTRRAAQRLAVP